MSILSAVRWEQNKLVMSILGVKVGCKWSIWCFSWKIL